MDRVTPDVCKSLNLQVRRMDGGNRGVDYPRQVWPRVYSNMEHVSIRRLNQLEIFSPTMPRMMRDTLVMRSAVAGSLNMKMPRMTVPTAPIPVHTA